MDNEEKTRLRFENEKERVSLAMNVGELIEKLEKYSKDLPVVIETFGYPHLIDCVHLWNNTTVSQYCSCFKAVVIQMRT